MVVALTGKIAKITMCPALTDFFSSDKICSAYAILNLNHLNLPDQVAETDDSGSMVWLYDANGNKLRKTTETSNLSLNGIITSGRYEADQINASGTVQSGSTVIFQAQSQITLLPGFIAKPGSDLSANIAPGSPDIQDYVNGIEYRDGTLEAR